ncbi:hypothetical protein [Streptomyces coelicoflavus]|uniref:hypothetical protein n=1 Tax=Streptomyces coelicoflavus TaxID=285562 RepID=UPI0036AF9B5B
MSNLTAGWIGTLVAGMRKASVYGFTTSPVLQELSCLSTRAASTRPDKAYVIFDAVLPSTASPSTSRMT